MSGHLPPHEPGGQLPKETPAPFAAFVAFRDAPLDKRDIGALAKANGRAPGTWYTYSRRFRWRERAEEWDLELQRVRDQVIISDVERVQAEHLEVLQLARDLGTLSLRRHRDRAQVDAEDLVPPTDVKEALALVKETVVLERLILGKATSREESRRTIDVAQLPEGRAEEVLHVLTEAGYSPED